MSKIPQGEWNAIAARYAQGETISQIARRYGCTPPAIHYILKRNGQRAAETGEQQPAEASRETPPTVVRETAQPPATSRSSGPRWSMGERQAAPRQANEFQTNELCAGRDRELPSVPRPRQSERGPVIAAQQNSGNPQTAVRTSAFTAGLDSELHGRAEAAI